MTTGIISAPPNQTIAPIHWPATPELSLVVPTTLEGTPAMAADLTDYVWSIDELLRYRCRRE